MRADTNNRYFNYFAFIAAMLFGLFILRGHASMSKLYMRNTQFDGYACSPEDLMKIFDNIKTSLACVERCVEYGCLSLFYYPSTKRCLGCHTSYSSDLQPAANSEGSLFYQPSLECPNSFVRYNNSCYSVTTSTMSWNNAKDYCESINAHLAIIGGLAENNFVANWLESERDGRFNFNIYFGMTDSQNEGTWRTINGNRQQYLNWDDGQPDGSVATENCGVINLKTKKWRDSLCEDLKIALCELEFV